MLKLNKSGGSLKIHEEPQDIRCLKTAKTITKILRLADIKHGKKAINKKFFIKKIIVSLCKTIIEKIISELGYQ